MENEIISGKVTGITKFGAFVKLQEGPDGLIHISEIADGYVKDINEYLKVGDEVKVKVLGKNSQGKIALSLKQASVTSAPESVLHQVSDDRGEGHCDPFETKIKDFLKKSEEKLTDLKRNVQDKQGFKKRRKKSQ